MATQQGRHAAPRPRHTLRTVLACVAVVCVLAAGLAGVYVYSHAQGSSQPAEPRTGNQSSPTTSKPADSQAVAGSATTPTPESDQQEPTPANDPTTVEVMMIGDVLMHDELVTSGLQEDGSYDFHFLFDHIHPYIDAANVRILNQETVMGEPERGYSLRMGDAGPIMNTPTALADTEANLGFNVILKATNHTYDLGYSGLGHELDYWGAAHPTIPVIGVNNPNAAQDDDSQNWVDNVYVGDFNGMRIGFLNYTWATNENIDAETDPLYISYLSDDKVRADVEKARAAGAEMLIACPHWGIEYDTTPSEEEMHYSQLFCELGVDVIFGCHPHVLQPVELLQNAEGHKTVCFYSMSDFVCAGLMQTNALMGGVARTTLERAADGTCSVSAASIVPTVICYTTGSHMSAYPLTEWTEELAAESYRSELTPDYARAFFGEVFGNTYNDDESLVTLNVDGEARTV